MSLKPNIAIIGSGISGLTCANILSDKHFNPIVYEKNDNYGGLISCSSENGNLFHRVGGHVFNTKLDYVSKWFWRKFDRDRDFLKAKRNASIFIGDRFVNYPIELNLNQLDKEITKNIVHELIELSKPEKKSFKHSNYSFDKFLRNNFGQTLYSMYFKKYNEKIWNKDLKKIPIDWLDGKLPMIRPKEILINNIISSKEDNMVHSTFYYPKKGGSQFLVDKLSYGLNIVKEDINNIFCRDNNLFINNDKTNYKALIFTGDSRKLSNILNNDLINELELEKELDEIAQLQTNPTTTILCECDKNDYSWVYFPSENIKPHRMIMTGNFSLNNNRKDIEKDRISCTVECTGKVDSQEFIEELKKLPFNPKYISYNFCANSYIIQNQKTRKVFASLKLKLKSKNIFLCGRFAEWEYFNMDLAISSAMKNCQNIITYV